MASARVGGVARIVTDGIIGSLERGVAPWRQPWRAGRPVNAVSGRPYRGINAAILGIQPYEYARYLTYRQALELGGHVRRGEEGHRVVFWRTTQAEEDDEPARPVLRYYTVFNVQQCEDLPQRVLIGASLSVDSIVAGDALYANMPNRPALEHGGDRAYYRPADDTVHLPVRGCFTSPEAYYGVLAHELVHATGAAHRLDRPGIASLTPYGSPDYSFEELIAELGSAMLLGTVGIPSQEEVSAAYIASWLRVLQDDRYQVLRAATQAQRAADYILGETPQP